MCVWVCACVCSKGNEAELNLPHTCPPLPVGGACVCVCMCLSVYVCVCVSVCVVLSSARKMCCVPAMKMDISQKVLKLLCEASELYADNSPFNVNTIFSVGELANIPHFSKRYIGIVRHKAL